MDFKEFFEQNKKACIGGLAGAVVILMGIAVATSHTGGDSTVETAAASTEAAETTTVETAPVEVTRGDFYDKLNSGNAVNVLVLGDGFAYGDGATNLEDSWSEQLSQKLGDAFKSNVFVNNYALAGDNGAYAGFVIANELTTDVEYDAAVLSFGSYDDQDTFPAFYEALIRALNKKFPGIEIISLIEPSSVTNPDGPAAANADAIKNITSHYLGETIDIAKGFEDAGKDVKKTVAKDQINQNDEGNDITSDVILSAIQASAAAGDQKGETQTIQPLDEKISELESFAYIPASSFAKLNDTTYEILSDYVTDADGNKLQGLLGLDYDYLTGDNDVYVTVDGQPFGRHSVKFDGAESEQHIVLINDNFTSADHVTIKFATKEEADTFAGMSICGNIALPESYDKFETMAADDELSAEDTSAYDEEALASYNAQVEALKEQIASAQETLTDSQAKLEETTLAAYAEIEATAQEALDKALAGEDFDTLIETYGEDTGMNSEPNKSRGYLVCEGLSLYEQSFQDAAMALEQVGDVSTELVKTSYGYHILQYATDVAEGEVEYTDEIKNDIHDEMLTDAQDAAYDAAITQWVSEAEVKTYPKVMK